MGVGVAGADPKAGRPLVGRDQELERLFGMIDQLAGHGGALVVRGEAGIGKSALLEAAGERARERGANGGDDDGHAVGGAVGLRRTSSTAAAIPRSGEPPS